MADHSSYKSYWNDAEKIAADDPYTQAQTKMCDHPSCMKAGEFRAPKTPGGNQYYMFCLEHVQAYNKEWNYYKGLSVDEMEQVRRNDVVGWRPTWPLGSLRGRDPDRMTPDDVRAHVFREFFGGGGPSGGPSAGAKRAGGKANPAANDGYTAEEQDAFKHFNLAFKSSWYEIKRRYRELVKTYHPDTHQQESKLAEEQIKLINRAYAVLKRRFNRK